MPCRSIAGSLCISLVCWFGIVSPVHASTIRINEFSIEPVTMQSVELYNAGDISVDISGWILDDEGSVSTKYTIAQGTTIAPGMCLVFSSGNFSFNKSSADGAKLYAGDEVIDAYSYSKSPGEGISFARIPDGSDMWASKSASLGSLNSTGDPCLAPPTATVTPSPTCTPKPAATSTPSLTQTSAPATPSPSKTPTFTLKPTMSVRPTLHEVSDILGIHNTVSNDPEIEKPKSGKEDAAVISSGTHARPVIFSLLLIGTGMGFLAAALALHKTEVWKTHIGSKKDV